MDTMLVRLKPYDPRRSHILRRFTVAGIKFHADRGWYRVEKDVAQHLKGVHQIHGDEHSPLAFDVCTDAEAKNIDEKERANSERKAAADNIPLSRGRDGHAVTTNDLAEAQKKGKKG